MSKNIDRENRKNQETRIHLASLLKVAVLHLDILNITSSKGSKKSHAEFLSGYNCARKSLDKALEDIINNKKHPLRDELIAIAAFAVLGIESYASLKGKKTGDIFVYRKVKLNAVKLKESNANITLVCTLQKMVIDRYFIGYRAKKPRYAYTLPKALVELVKETYRV